MDNLFDEMVELIIILEIITDQSPKQIIEQL